MANAYSLVYGSTTITLSVLDYPMATPEQDAETVEEYITLDISGSTSALLQTALHALENAFEAAERRQAGQTWDRVYIQILPDGYTGTYRSEILAARVVLPEDALKGTWANHRLEVTAVWERRAYWEAVTEVQLPLSNTNAADNTSGLTVYNCMDGSGSPPTDRVNYTDIDGDDVVGSLPAPLRLEITNNFNNATGISLIYAGMARYADLAAFDPLLEAEDATGGVDAVDANCSGGDYSAYAITAPGDNLMYTWTLTAARVAACMGRDYKILARFADSSGITDVWFHTLTAASIPGALVRPSNYYARVLRDLGTVQLPPWLGGVGSPGAVNIELYGRRAVELTQTINLDFLFLMPTDSYREYQMLGELEYQYTLVDNGTEDMVYTQDSSGANRQGNVTAIGEPLMVEPGRDARIYFLHHLNLADSAPITRTLSIKAFYRPRRSTL